MNEAKDRGAKLRGHLEHRIRDAQYERELYEEQLEVNARLVHGDHKGVFAAGSDNNYFAANMIENIVVTQTAVMTESDIRPVYVPRETNEPPEIFLKPESAYKAQGMGLSDMQMRGEEVIPEQLFDFLSAQTRTEEVDNPEAGQVVGAGENATPQPDTIEVQVAIFNDDDFIFVDDALCAEALTQEVASQWEISASDERVRQSIYEAVALGWKDILIQWNAHKHHFDLAPIYPFDGWIDRWAISPRDAEYYALRQIMPVAEAMKEYPEAAAQIEKHKTIATENNSWGSRQGGKYLRSTEREIVEIYTLWERHHPIPKDPEEALEQGLVEVAMEEPLVDPDTREIVDMGGPIMDEAGEPQFITAEGVATTPGDENWPVRHGIRQLRMLGEYVIQDIEVDAVDLPVARIRNIPIIESPYGEGEPQRVAELQDLINRLWSIYHDYCMFFRGSEQAMPQSLLDQIGTGAGTMHRTMGRKFGVPDDLWQSFEGRLFDNVDPPQLSPVFDRIMQILEAQMDRISGIGQVLRGEAKSEWSGSLFEQATNAARGPIGYKARHVADAVKHSAMIIAGYIIDFLPVEEWAKRNKKYPIQVLEVMRDRLKAIGYDVSVEVGGAESRQSQSQKLSIALQNTPVLVNSPTFMKQYTEHFGLKDGDQIVNEIQQASQPAPPA